MAVTGLTERDSEDRPQRRLQRTDSPQVESRGVGRHS